MSLFNTLYLGEPLEAAECLEPAATVTTEETALALINALRRIATLENQMRNLRKDLNL